MRADRRDTSPLAGRIQKSLSHCVKEGITAQQVLGIMDYYLIPYALFLGASTQQIGLLVAIPNLLSSLSHFYAVPAMRWAGSRRALMLWGSSIQAGVLLLLANLSFLPADTRILFLTVFVALFRVLGSLFGPSWGSLVSEYLPDNRRGHFFGRRARIVGVSGMIGVAFWGSALHAMRHLPDGLNFAALFLAAAGFRALSSRFLSKMVDLPMKQTAESDFTFWMFIRRFRESNFVRYIFFVGGITFSIQLAAPYFSVYMLEVLGFNYAQYTAVHLSAAAMGFFAFPIWGRHADALGNARILKITSAVIPVIPLLWIVSRNVYALIAVELFAGFVLCGFNLCVMNFIYEAVSPDKRIRCLGYFNAINGACAFAGASLGGVLAAHLPPLFGHPIFALFLLSAIGRLAADFFLAHHFEEVRPSPPRVSSFDLFFSVVGLRPILGRTGELMINPGADPEPFFRRSRVPRRKNERP